jgi:transcriptional regulator with XRE-family HTH domain
MTPWGAFLQDQLQRRGWSVRAFARRVGMDPSFLSKAMRGAPHGRSKTPALPPLAQIEGWLTVLQLSEAEQERFLDLTHLSHAPERVARRTHEAAIAYEQLQQERQRLQQEVERLRERLGDG